MALTQSAGEFGPLDDGFMDLTLGSERSITSSMIVLPVSRANTDVSRLDRAVSMEIWSHVQSGSSARNE